MLEVEMSVGIIVRECNEKKGNDKLFTVSWIKILTVDRNISENIKSNSLEDEDLFPFLLKTTLQSFIT